MKRRSVLEKQSVKRNRKDFFCFKRGLGQFGFVLIKIFFFLLALGGVSLGFVSGYRFLSTSQYFRLDKIAVKGINSSLREEVVKASGLEGVENLFSIDMAEIQRKIEAHPWIRSASLKRGLPHTLYVEAEAQKALAIALLDDMYFINEHGVAFKQVEQDEYRDFPVITGLKKESGVNGESIGRVLLFLGTLDFGNTRFSIEDISEIHVDRYGGISVYLVEHPFRVFMGKGDFVEKLHLLSRVTRHLKDNQRLYDVRIIDLDYPEGAVVGFENNPGIRPGDRSHQI